MPSPTKKIGKALAFTALFGTAAMVPTGYAATYGTLTASVNLPTSSQRTSNLRTSELSGTTVYAGQFSGTFSNLDFTPPVTSFFGDPNPTDDIYQFVGWCLEPQEYWAQNSTYSFVDIGNAPDAGAGSTMTTRGVDDDLRRLFGGLNPNTDTSFIGTDTNSRLKRDAFQLAIWEIANELGADPEDDPTNISFDVKSGTFHLDWIASPNGWSGSASYFETVASQANAWLASAASTTSGWLEAVLYAIVSPGTEPNGRQDFVVQAPGTGGGTTPVPLPAAFWLFGTAMLGLLGFARVRRQA